ncbi:MAG: succinylglutamate desuccinylase/aspartoacylase family protein [Proteobacteria bacterium]|nr:succinylglutamate desuccinylase/aspartoacylase family protein [Pseudomonadota bacterium]
MSGPAELDIPLDRPGRIFGAMRLPWSHDESAYGQIVIPVIVINGAPGPTLLATAGVHGDEYEGQVALSDLARDIEPSSLRGRLIIVPAANAPAAAIGRRTSPIDGGNLARVFPGHGDGTPTTQIAEGITRLLLPAADFVIDMHSGGRTLEYMPCAWARLPADKHLRARTLDALIAFGAPDAGVVAKPQAIGTFLSAAQSAGKVAISTELGGAGTLTPYSLSVAREGIARFLGFAGLTVPKPIPKQVRLLAVEPRHFVRSPGRGLFEPATSLGQSVAAGDIAGRLHDIERPDRAPETIRFEAPGIVMCRRVPARTEAGDVVAHLGQPSTREALL